MSKVADEIRESVENCTEGWLSISPEQFLRIADLIDEENDESIMNRRVKNGFTSPYPQLGKQS